MPRYIEQLNECTDPVTADWLWIVDDSALADDKDRKLSVGKLALLGTAQTFTKAQTIAPNTTGVVGLAVNMPSGATADGIAAQYNGIDAIALQVTASAHTVNVSSWDNGAVFGGRLLLGRNNNASTPAGGFITFINAIDAVHHIWADAAGQLRIHTSTPISTRDTSGVVVGTQTSHIEYKDIVGTPLTDAEALDFICTAAAQVARFVYKSGAFGGQEFSGIVLDGPQLDRYGQDADAEHPAGKSLNMSNAIGDLFLAMRGMAERVQHLESRIQAMEAT